MSLLGLTCRLIRSAAPGSVPKRYITSKTFRQVRDKPPPYDWKNKDYPLLLSLIKDRTTDRFDENTKVIVVEGPVASGKTAFAKELADQLDMLHMEDVSMDTYYINPYGYDMRQLDDKMPEDLRSFDEASFNQNPKHRNVAAFQAIMYRLRLSKYIDCLAHVLSTGQGVVIERSPWTDHVFTDAMAKHNYISRQARYVIGKFRENTLFKLMRPHLVIYLDVPVPQVMENIKKRNKYSEANGKALTKAYLEDVEEIYKTKYLPKISEHAELMIYDWAQPGEVEVVVEDIERIDFDQYTKYDNRMKDWDISVEKFWAEQRRLYADHKGDILSYLNIPLLDAPELWASGEDYEKYLKVWNSAPGMEYAKGFNPAQGDTGYLFKRKVEKYIPF